eukprot:COSAG02_NODE_3865_length_6124_cov_27.767303_5_plen_116_part_00
MNASQVAFYSRATYECEAAADKAAADKAAADKAAADKEVADKAVADKAAADKEVADKAAADKAVADKAAASVHRGVPLLGFSLRGWECAATAVSVAAAAGTSSILVYYSERCSCN